ncbi:hypothetical protein FHX49_000838 [Microbacterium endophyticum]|uniref:Uncharacterized protein n=1 Tax=Microbacterium endophyticum TaxID=1526412 RepID=A0A7W4V1R3_9MICO|nr:hypothetical protein [Microbacterium endophyticum]NIK35709.1 hypothetical protein [Microbacterium endophyticum]
MTILAIIYAGGKKAYASLMPPGHWHCTRYLPETAPTQRSSKFSIRLAHPDAGH